jgi:hypothetical protein
LDFAAWAKGEASAAKAASSARQWRNGRSSTFSDRRKRGRYKGMGEAGF